jgi:hypothetical protein
MEQSAVGTSYFDPIAKPLNLSNLPCNQFDDSIDAWMEDLPKILTMTRLVLSLQYVPSKHSLGYANFSLNNVSIWDVLLIELARQCDIRLSWVACAIEVLFKDLKFLHDVPHERFHGGMGSYITFKRSSYQYLEICVA